MVFLIIPTPQTQVPPSSPNEMPPRRLRRLTEVQNIVVPLNETTGSFLKKQTHTQIFGLLLLPSSTFAMAPSALAARFGEAITKCALRSYLAEFISTFFFVLAVVGSALSSRMYIIIPNFLISPANMIVLGEIKMIYCGTFWHLEVSF